MNYSEAKAQKDRVDMYRTAFRWMDGGCDLQMQEVMDDLEDFCGLNQARFEGDQHEMLKQLGRLEVLGRIRFHLKYDDNMYRELEKIIKEMDDE